jgi:L-iditol 2-dehydrogenase
VKAVVKTRKGDGYVQLMDVDKPEIEPDEVLIGVKAVSICGSDLHIWHDEHPYWPPMTMGHEFSGEIVDVGGQVTGWKVGDRVVSETRTETCGICRYCQTGVPQVCPNKRPPGIGINGAMAKFVAMPARLLHRIPDNVSYDAAAVTEPTAVCLHGIIERTRINAGDNVVVLGPGPIGLMSVQLAKLAGASNLITVGTPRSAALRLKKAKDIGSGITINLGEEDPVEKVMDLTGGYGADMVIEAAGSSEAIKLAFDLVRRHGKICALGINGKEATDVPWDKAIFKAVQLTFCFSSSWQSWETVLQLMAKDMLKLDDIITHRLPLEQWREAFEALENREAIKAILNP